MAGRQIEDEYYEIALNLVKESAKILKDAINGSKNIHEKQGDWDLVTEYDKKIEDIIINKLKSIYPSHR